MALRNIQAFDRDAYAAWLLTRSACVQDIAHLWPPDRIYALPHNGTLCVIEGYVVRAYGAMVSVRLLVPGAPALVVPQLIDVTEEVTANNGKRDNPPDGP